MNFLRTTSTGRLDRRPRTLRRARRSASSPPRPRPAAAAPAPGQATRRRDPRLPRGAQAHRHHRTRPLHEQPDRERRAADRLAAAHRRERTAVALRRSRAPRAAVGRRRCADHARRRPHLGLRRLQQHRLPRERGPAKPRPTRQRSPSRRADRRRRSRRPSRSWPSTRPSRAPIRRRRPASPPTRSRSRPSTTPGLLGQAELAWDAANGIPLRISIAAAGSSSPVLALDVTDISYGASIPSALAVTPPARREVVDLGSLGHSARPDGSPVNARRRA